jgi:hypothetical protein
MQHARDCGHHREAARYTDAVDRKRLAQSATAKVQTLIVKPDERFAKKR